MKYYTLILFFSICLNSFCQQKHIDSSNVSYVKYDSLNENYIYITRNVRFNLYSKNKLNVEENNLYGIDYEFKNKEIKNISFQKKLSNKVCPQEKELKIENLKKYDKSKRTSFKTRSNVYKSIFDSYDFENKGCDDNADIAKHILYKKKIYCFKVTALYDSCTPYINVKNPCEEWLYHETLAVLDEFGDLIIFDPYTSDKPLPYEIWMKKLLPTYRYLPNYRQKFSIHTSYCRTIDQFKNEYICFCKN